MEPPCAMNHSAYTPATQNRFEHHHSPKSVQMSAPQKMEATSPFSLHQHEAMDIPAEPRLEDENVRCAKRARSCTAQSKLRSQKVCPLDAV